jgi:hypothetical protein
MNWCSIVLTQLLVKLIRWTKCQKKATTNLVPNRTKVDNCYSGPILDVLFEKWFPLSKVPSPRITTPKEPVSPTRQK